ncbi:ABC transporter permease [Ideonella sp. YS5]|uniref:ABC transporter permease n=1 Tax=Ideonella sp. YS5 TaxID=3453714 RepID=UPI003EEE9E8E
MNRLLPIEWLAALRFLNEGRLQTLFIVGGVAVGVGVIVFMSALLDGMQANIFRRVLSSQPHIVISRPKDVARPLRVSHDGQIIVANVQKRSQIVASLDQWRKVREQMRRRGDIVAVSPTAGGSGFAIRGDASQSISLVGIDPQEYAKIVPLPDKLVAGTFRLTTTDMIVGTQLADDLGVRVGDKLRVATASGASATLSIAAIFDLGSKGVNQRNVYVELATAQNLLNLVGGVSNIDLTVADPFRAEEIAQQIGGQTGLLAESWIKTNNQFFLGLNAQKFSSYLIRVFVGLSVAAGIASVLVVSVVQRSKEIGILRAMGGSRGQVLRVFLIQGAVVGLAGSLVGSALGTLLLEVWRLAARNPDGTPMFAVSVDYGLYLWAAVLATLTGLVAAVTPAVRAARLDPVAAIRG